MNLSEIIKKQGFFQNLIKEKEKNTLSSALLFFCEDELTAFKVQILTALLLEYPTFEMLNDSSTEFLRIENNIELDVKIYPKDQGRLVVADSNDIVAEAYAKPVNLPYKIFIIKNFDSATEEAQNKLLKILEEPPKNVYFLLHACNEDRVLPTIKSRCDKIKISPLSQEEIKKFSHNKLANILGDGYIGKTLFLSKQENLEELTDFAVSLFTEMKNSKNVLKFSSKMLKYKDDLDLILRSMLLCIEDIIKIKCEKEDLCKLDLYKDQLKDVEPEFSIQALCEISAIVTKLKEKMEFNANLTVAFDNLLLKFLEVKYLCK